jgi:uncharacterized protein YbaP (TraB family)
MIRYLAGLFAALAFAAPAWAQPPVWIVRDADSELVLFGSVHVLPPGLDWRPAALDQALARADDVWFELPIGPEAEQEVARLAGAQGVLPPGQSLFAMLPPADAKRLVKVAGAYAVDTAMLDRLEPWLAEVALGGAVYRKAGADTANGVEQAIATAAPPGAQRRALETPAQQIAFFDTTPLADQLASLRETIREIDQDPDGYKDLVDAWMAGDVRALDKEALAPMRKITPGVFRRLVTERNAAWVRELDARLKGHGRTVVVVGVGHLVGKGGLPAQLRALGYSVSGP